MGLGGKVVSTVGKGAVKGTKTLAKGAGKLAGNTLSATGKGIANMGRSVSTKDRGAQAESMLGRVMKEADTTGKTEDGYSY